MDRYYKTFYPGNLLPFYCNYHSNFVLHNRMTHCHATAVNYSSKKFCKICPWKEEFPQLVTFFPTKKMKEKKKMFYPTNPYFALLLMYRRHDISSTWHLAE
jgi:hypothetical protein